MSVAVYCPVYGCQKIAVGQCSSYGGKCSNSYCQTHAKMCDRCARFQHENNLVKYEMMIDGIARRAKNDAWTPRIATFFYLALMLIAATAVICFFVTIGNVLITFLVFLIEIVVSLIPIFWHAAKTRERIDDEVTELERKNPGFLEAYELWKTKEREKIPDSTGI